ncbi:hypothetical protein [Sulfuracidifex metallicus]|uniref:hypothetical protein n=1 Tax=Sulfuracidifex metallicus TaxID=47303 RepID=UPI0022764209|nr:hypothetical protein [Sulfuracidifex metallicus]MCY0851089.1 hypothetical protein [Sulfuracidifex metallicus]
MELPRLLKGAEYGLVGSISLGILGFVLEVFLNSVSPHAPSFTAYFPELLGFLGFAIGFVGAIRNSTEDLLQKRLEMDLMEMENQMRKELKEKDEANGSKQ